MAPIRDYVKFLRQSGRMLDKYGLNGAEFERARLHNDIFLAAGFRDTKWGSARKTAAWFETMYRQPLFVNDPDIGYDESLVEFKRALDDALCDYLDGGLCETL